jgi:hypothetical protein
MKRLLVLLTILSLLPAAGVYAASNDQEQGRSRRSPRALPGPQADVESLCDRLLSNGSGGYIESDDRRSEPGPDDVDNEF